jgi:hypothetical protein
VCAPVRSRPCAWCGRSLPAVPRKCSRRTAGATRSCVRGLRSAAPAGGRARPLPPNLSRSVRLQPDLDRPRRFRRLVRARAGRP